MPTNPVKSDLKLGTTVLSAIKEFRPRAVEKLDKVPIAEDVTPVNYGAVLDDMYGRLSWAHDDLLEMNAAYTIERANDTKRSKQRNEDTANLRQVMVRVRGMFENCYKPVRIEEFGFSRELERDAEKLVLQGKQLVTRLREPDLPLPEPLSERSAQDPLELADIVESPLKQLDDALEFVRKEFRGAQLMKPQHDQTVERYKRTLSGSALMARGIFLLADEKELADRIKPSAVKPSRSGKETDEADESQEKAESDPEAAAESTEETPDQTESGPPEESSEGSEDQEP